jgi:hypothetical protein
MSRAKSLIRCRDHPFDQFSNLALRVAQVLEHCGAEILIELDDLQLSLADLGAGACDVGDELATLTLKARLLAPEAASNSARVNLSCAASRPRYREQRAGPPRRETTLPAIRRNLPPARRHAHQFFAATSFITSISRSRSATKTAESGGTMKAERTRGTTGQSVSDTQERQDDALSADRPSMASKLRKGTSGSLSWTPLRLPIQNGQIFVTQVAGVGRFALGAHRDHRDGETITSLIKLAYGFPSLCALSISTQYSVRSTSRMR